MTVDRPFDDSNEQQSKPRKVNRMPKAKKEVVRMTDNEVTKALVAYRMLEEQKNELEKKQADLKKQLSDHMDAQQLKKIEATGIVAQYVGRPSYAFDIPGIVAAVPEAMGMLKLSNENYEKLLVGNEQKIGTLRRLVANPETLTIRVRKENPPPESK